MTPNCLRSVWVDEDSGDHPEENPRERQAGDQRAPELLRPHAPGDGMGDDQGADDPHAEPDHQRDPGEQEVPACMVLRLDRVHGGLRGGAADPEVLCGVLQAHRIRVYPEAQDGREDESEGDEPEEEPVREPAGEQPGGAKSFTFERGGHERGTGKVLTRPVTRTTRAFQCFDQPRLRRWLGGLRHIQARSFTRPLYL